MAALEFKLDTDPFQELVSITSIRTVGDLERAYTASLAGLGGAEDDLAEVRRAAEARKAAAGGAL